MPETEAPQASNQKSTENSNDWVLDSIRDALTECPVVLKAAKTLSEQLQGLAERPLKNSELSTLAHTLIAALKETPPKEPTL